MIGQTISHYKILEKLGGGGMGVVYKAQDTKLDRIVALKFLPPDLTRDPAAREGFIHEAKPASALQHPHICTIDDINETADNQLFIVMDCYEGETLKKKIKRGSLKLDEACDLAIQIGQGSAKLLNQLANHPTRMRVFGLMMSLRQNLEQPPIASRKAGFPPRYIGKCSDHRFNHNTGGAHEKSTIVHTWCPGAREPAADGFSITKSATRREGGK